MSTPSSSPSVPRARREFSPQFRAEVAAMVIELGKTRAEVARELGLHESLVGKWVRAAQGRAPASRVVPSGGQVAALEAEVVRLRRENEFLKKAAAFFAKESM